MITSAVLLSACADPPARVTAEAEPGGVHIVADRAFSQVELVRDGSVVARRVWPVPVSEAWIDAQTGSGEFLVRTGPQGATTTAVSGTGKRLWVRVSAPIGAPFVEVHDGDALAVGAGGDALVEVIGAQKERLSVPIGEPVEVARDGVTVRFEIVADPHLTESLAGQIAVTESAFPAAPGGGADPTRVARTVTLAPDAQVAVLQRLGLGVRPDAAQAPWASEWVRIANRAKVDVDAVVTARVERDGALSPVFRPRLRDGDVSAVRLLVRIPAQSSATVTIPVWVDRDAAEVGVYDRVIEVSAIGQETPLAVDHAPIVVTRPGIVASTGSVIAVVGTLGGLAMLLARGRAWMDRPTSELTTIAMFAAAQHAVVLVAHVGLSVAAAVLGPAAPFVVGLGDATLRAAILAVLVTLAPRTGTAALFIVIAALLRLISLGVFGPVDAVYAIASVLWLEGALWIGRRGGSTGIAIALGVAGCLQAITVFAAHIALYRMYYAPWYIAAEVIGPAGIYVTVGALLGARVARALKQVER